MTIFLPDTNCLIASLADWHEHAARARSEINARLNRGETMVLAAHSLVEVYSSLTRMPRPRRVSGPAAVAAIEVVIGGASEVVSLDGPAYLQLVRSAPGRAVLGGSIYDFVIHQCALAAGADVLLTFNLRHFTNLGGPLQVVAPA